MADVPKKDDDAPQEEPQKKSRKGLYLGGSLVALVATAYLLSLMAVPLQEKRVPFDGPFVIDLFPEKEKLQVNLSGDGGKRYLVMTLKAEFEAYSEAYAASRVAEPLYRAMEKDALIKVARKKTKDDLSDHVGEEVFKHEVRDAMDPILFPVHVGNPMDAHKAHEKSGLRAGRSNFEATLRSGFYDNILKVDAPNKTLELGQGPLVSFEGDETDLLVENERGEYVYVDVSGLHADFIGELHVGPFGTIKSIYFNQFLVQ